MPDEVVSSGAAPAEPSAIPPASPPPPPSASAPVSAERAAAEAGDFERFDAAHTAKRQQARTGAPAPGGNKFERKVASYEQRIQAGAARLQELEGHTAESGSAPTSTGDAPPAATTAERRQQIVNDYERRVYEQEARIRELEGRMRAVDASRPPPAPAPPENTVKARAKQLLARPDAPKLEDYDTYPEYTAAQALFVRETLDAEQAADAQQRAQQQERHEALIARDQGFRERLTAAKAADPTFVERLSEEARNLGGLDHARRTGQQPGPIHIIGELLYDSPQAVPFLNYISANPDALRALVTPPASLQRVHPQRRVQAHIDHLVTEFRRLEGRLAYEASLASAGEPAAPPAPQPETRVSSAPPPPPTLSKAGRSTDPIRSAIARGDFDAFDQAEQARRLARRQGRA